MVVKQFRGEEEEACFLLADPKKDIKRSKGGEIVEWISRSNKEYNLAAEPASKSIVELPNERYALDFQKFVGSRVNNTQFLTGAISEIEMYYTRRKEKELPTPVKQLIIHMVVTTKTHISRRLIRNDGPLKKKKTLYSSL